MSVQTLARPTLNDLRGVALGPVQEQILRDLVDGPFGAVVGALGRRARSFDPMEGRLRTALCDLGWTIAWDHQFIVLKPFTVSTLRWHLKCWPTIRPSNAVIGLVLTPVAGTTLNDTTLDAARMLLELTWLAAEDVIHAAVGIAAPS